MAALRSSTFKIDGDLKRGLEKIKTKISNLYNIYITYFTVYFNVADKRIVLVLNIKTGLYNTGISVTNSVFLQMK